jgi:hypothetical protein
MCAYYLHIVRYNLAGIVMRYWEGKGREVGLYPHIHEVQLPAGPVMDHMRQIAVKSQWQVPK